MPDKIIKTNGPVVTVLIPTYNRRRYLPLAVESVINQDYQNLEIFVMNDGGEDVSDIIESFHEPRINFINGKENRGKPYRLNQALAKAQGKYVCYLDDDDLFYRHHVSTLVDILENKTDCQLAYSDLYKTYCRIEADGTRTPLSKKVEISRDFDQMFMFYFNHVLHVSLMHRRDLWDKVGPYDESLNVLIDWYLTKRLVFYTDFYHTHEITGEFYAALSNSDRISVKRREDQKDYCRNVMAIRQTRPPKPWPKVKDLSIIFTAETFDQTAGNTVGNIWRHTFYPYQVYLSMPPEDFARLSTDMMNLVNVPVARGSSVEAQVDKALAVCEGDFVAIVPKGHSIHEMWIEDPLYALINSEASLNGFELELSNDEHWAAVLRKDVLLRTRRNSPNVTLKESLIRSGVDLKKLQPEEIPFQFDELHHEAQAQIKDGNWARAAQIYEYIVKNHTNNLWMRSQAGQCFFKSGDYKKALEHSRQINSLRPTVDTMLTEARVHRRQKDFCKAIELLEEAKQILEGKYIPWTKSCKTHVA
ncbi:MAG: glycosyltransferase [Sedimentisphaerales bacterium]|nr:glycosyltransferase [Sedimentisphaerales bacterium]